jgi:pyrimidine-nucleoside phosphorylase
VNLLPLLEAKRDGGRLTDPQIRDLIAAHTTGRIPDYQMAAFLMAAFFRGLDGGETRALTLAMRDSGEALRFPDDPRPLVDKHSTGGVGDKVSLPLAPLLACLGFRVPMISGRGLGITGGTLDKLESIPGFITALTSERIVEVVQTVGCCLAGQTAFMVPADMKLYALRDATATVPSIPLITASILSKKLAESISALVLDVKFGRAAFMPTLEQARELARNLVTIAGESGVNTRAFLTDMNTPLGRTAGNWLEVREAVDCLECRGPEDLQELVLHCAASLLVQTGRSPDMNTALNKAAVVLASGKPREKWDQLLVAQGADLDAFNRKLKLDHTAPVLLELVTPDEGFITGCDARVVGEVVRELGGGRFRQEDGVNHDVGLDLLAKPGEPCGVNSVLARVHATTKEQGEAALAKLRGAFQFQREPVPVPVPLIVETVQ